MHDYNDFFEGVKNVLVDKNHKPKWTHDCPLKVTEEELNKIFSPLGDKELLIWYILIKYKWFLNNRSMKFRIK